MEDIRMRTAGIVGSLLLLLCISYTVIAQERQEQPPTPKPFITKHSFTFTSENAITKTPIEDSAPFQFSSQLPLRNPALQGDLRVRLLGGFNLMADQIFRSLPGERFVPGRYSKLKIGYVTERFAIYPKARFHWSQKWWEREASAGLSIQW
jgi:hypothetical protein